MSEQPIDGAALGQQLLRLIGSGQLNGVQLTALHLELDSLFEAIATGRSVAGAIHLVAGYGLLRQSEALQSFPAFFAHFDPKVLMLAVEALDPPLLRATLTTWAGDPSEETSLGMALAQLAGHARLEHAERVKAWRARARVLGADEETLAAIARVLP